MILLISCRYPYSSDQNWWRGQLTRGGNPGLFPSSFVTNDLTVPDENSSIVETVRNEPVMPKQAPQINEDVLKRCIELLNVGHLSAIYLICS